jgi:hypothetical protein
MEVTSKMVVIDTDRYAGSFEREMCAYITNQVGDCSVGRKEADIAEAEMSDILFTWCEFNVTQEEDDGCWRPCQIYPTPDRYNDGKGNHFSMDRVDYMFQRETYHPAYESVAIFVEQFPDGEVLAEIKERAKAFCKSHGIQITGMRFIEPVYKLVTTKVDINV